MKISDLVKLSTDNLRRRKGRTALTVIGVVVGTCAIVLMISLGIAVNNNTDEMLQNWGDLTTIEIYNYSGNGADPLDDTKVAGIAQMDHVLAATPYYQPNYLYGAISAGRSNRYQVDGLGNVYGLYPEAVEAMGISLLSGSYLTDSISLGKDKIPVLVGENFGYEFQDTKRSNDSPKRYRWQGMTDDNGNELPPFVDIDSDKMTLSYNDADGKVAKTYELVVVGVMAGDYGKGYFTMSGLVMRIADLEKLEAEYKKINKIKDTSSAGYNQVYVKVDEVNNVSDVESAIHDMGYENTWSMSQQRDEMMKNVAQNQMILGGLAAISLLVAALNIMNTMTMAIYERTREIGVMKVLGCELWQIRSMFLIESGAIGFLGGLVGVVISFAVSALLNNLALIVSWFGGTVDMSWISQLMGSWFYSDSATISIIPPWLVALALAFATVIGVLSGIAPAGRAVKISALEAIRHE